jgi:hypothetical protein
LSSSVPTVAIVAGAGVIAAIGTAVNKFLEAWEKIEKIRHIRAELKEMGMKTLALEELTEQVTTIIEDVVDESTKLTLNGYTGEQARRNELENALKQDTRRLFGQIERGLTIQFRAEPDKDDADEGDNKAALDTIAQISRTMKFPEIQSEPMLLTKGEILEGEIHTVKVSKRTITTSKATAKKYPERDIKL